MDKITQKEMTTLAEVAKLWRDGKTKEAHELVNGDPKEFVMEYFPQVFDIAMEGVRSWQCQVENSKIYQESIFKYLALNEGQ